MSKGVARTPGKRRIPERTRDALLAAAAELFVEQGLDGPSLDAICERAGYTRGAFYVHFATRDELVGAVVETSLRQFVDAIVGEGEPSLAAIIDAFVRALGEGRFPMSARVRTSQVLEACARSWELRVKYLAVLVSARQQIAAAVRRGQAEGSVRADLRPEAIADMLLAMVIGVQVATQLEAPYDARGVASELALMLAPVRASAAKKKTTTTKAAPRAERAPAKRRTR